MEDERSDGEATKDVLNREFDWFEEMIKLMREVIGYDDLLNESLEEVRPLRSQLRAMRRIDAMTRAVEHFQKLNV